MSGETGDSDARIRVLIVDDHQMVVQGLGMAVDRQPDMLVVGTAGTGEEAKLVAAETQPDVVLLDHHLPDVRGVAVASEIRRRRPQTAVVIVTGFADDEILLGAIEAGCSGFITKDKPVDEVLAAIRLAAAGEALISPAMLARLLPRLGRGQRGIGSDLTPRELEVLRLLAQGLSNQAIAERLYLSLNTVRNHVQNLISKLNSHSKLEAVATAVREGIISFPMSG